MTYIEEISSALVRVLTHACDGEPQRFAGYAANAGFWIGEAKHCLDVIDGYQDRFDRLRKATMKYASEAEQDEWGHNTFGLATRSTKYSDRATAKRDVLEVSRRFLKRCEKMRLLEDAELIACAQKLGINPPL